jgi:hypothetical protein
VKLLEDSGAALESFGHMWRNENRAERRVAAGNSLPYKDNVRFEPPVLDGEGLPRAAQSAHDFIGDQQDGPAAADFRDARRVTIGRNGSAERGAHDWLKQESRDGFGQPFVEKGSEIVGASDPALRKFLVARAVVAETRSDVASFSQQRLV